MCVHCFSLIAITLPFYLIFLFCSLFLTELFFAVAMIVQAYCFINHEYVDCAFIPHSFFLDGALRCVYFFFFSPFLFFL